MSTFSGLSPDAHLMVADDNVGAIQPIRLSGTMLDTYVDFNKTAPSRPQESSGWFIRFLGSCSRAFSPTPTLQTCVCSTAPSTTPYSLVRCCGSTRVLSRVLTLRQCHVFLFSSNAPKCPRLCFRVCVQDFTCFVLLSFILAKRHHHRYCHRVNTTLEGVGCARAQ